MSAFLYDTIMSFSWQLKCKQSCAFVFLTFSNILASNQSLYVAVVIRLDSNLMPTGGSNAVLILKCIKNPMFCQLFFIKWNLSYIKNIANT